MMTYDLIVAILPRFPDLLDEEPQDRSWTDRASSVENEGLFTTRSRGKTHDNVPRGVSCCRDIADTVDGMLNEAVR